MADMRRFLDLGGLSIYDAKIKTVISTGDAQALADAKKYFDDNKGLFEAAGTVATARKALEDAIAAVDAKVAAITDGTTIDSFADVEAALADKQAAGDYATKDEAQAMADGKDEAIAAAKKAGDDAQDALDAYKESNDAAVEAVATDVANLDAYIGDIPSDEAYADITTVIGYVNKKAEETLASAQGGSSETAASVKAQLDTYKTENNAKVNKNIEDIAALNTALDEEVARADAAEKANADAIKAISDDYLKGADKEELQGNINTVSAAVERLTNGVSADEVDGVNDLIAYVKTHGTEVTGMQDDIAENAEAISGVAGRMDTAEGKITALEGAVTTKAEQETVDGIGGRVTTAEGKITTLEGKMTTAEGEIDALQGDMTQAQTDIAALQEKFGDGENSVSDMIADAVAVETSARETAVAGVQANVDTLAETVATKADASVVETISGKVGTLETKVGTLETEMDEIQAASATHALKSEVEAVAGRVTTVEGKVGTLETEMDAIEGRMDDAEDAIADKANQTDVDGLTTRMATAEGNIAANTAALAKFTEITETEINALFA